jgi:hypothetical protein
VGSAQTMKRKAYIWCWLGRGRLTIPRSSELWCWLRLHWLICCSVLTSLTASRA